MHDLPTPKLSFLTFYSLAPQLTANFYGQFGISFQSERHGSGPLHYSFGSDGLVVELYPTADQAKHESAVMLGFEVKDAHEAAQIATSNNFQILERPLATSLGTRLILTDPDGRHVLFYSGNLEEKR